MNNADYASSTDSDDEDFVLPEKEEKSDSEPLDDENDIDENDGKQERIKKCAKSRKKETLNTTTENHSKSIDFEQEKRREEELWAAFLGDSDPPETNFKPPIKSTENIPKEKKSITQMQIQAPPDTSKIFEFAGEEIMMVQQEEREQKLSLINSQNTPKPSTSISVPGVKRPISNSGLSTVLNQISKRNKLNVLQKTKLDWDGFKSTEGINEELQTHNKGKGG